MRDKPFFAKDVELIDRQTVYNGFFKMDKLRVKHRLFAGGWSTDIDRELFVRGSAVAAVLYDPEHQLIGLVEQFRIGVLDDSLNDPQLRPWCMEVVAGMVEPNESEEEVILRELQEEAGIVPQKLQMICHYYASPGGTNERLTLYCAIADLSKTGGLYGLAEEGEDIRFLTIPENDVFKDLYSRDYNNAATLICLQWLQIHKDQL
ncbi:ADP-ribose diphosphatase [Candidatus Endobugula sertula]|uniref:ADP-ribose pyrophosphatase n=1 Tax=Candidatus Endobugula sertula TaxID=62101 RepID=A0A1D2QQG5_9GAMM|nr:ADP-ribose diphosphatase [Candidatus Endobugula sertula]